MKAHLKGVEIETARCRNHDLSVHDTAVGQPVQERVVQFGKIPVERTQIPALDEDISPSAKHDGPKAIPFRLVQERPLGGQLLGKLGQHRFDRRVDCEGGRVLGRHVFVASILLIGPVVDPLARAVLPSRREGR